MLLHLVVVCSLSNYTQRIDKTQLFPSTVYENSAYFNVVNHGTMDILTHTSGLTGGIYAADVPDRNTRYFQFVT